MKRSFIITLAMIAAIAVPLCASSGWARGLGVLGLGMTGGYVLAWDGSHTSGTNYFCNSTGSPVAASVVGSPTFGTSYGEGASDVGMQSDAVGEYLSVPDSGGALLDFNGAQTLWIRVYLNVLPASGEYTMLFVGMGPTSADFVAARVTDGGDLHGYSRQDGVITNLFKGGVVAGSWMDIAYSWDKGGQDHAAYAGGAWAEGVDALPSGDFSVDAVSVRMGTSDLFSSETEYVNISRFALVNGYKAAKPW